ncbi:MAG: group 1 glycosyl transferase [Parcubacteria group bacterium Gr01-1014_72]|nr:MAG: group 1 glycosyl transferase [Parcubacteria group bacterium Gr01-1014_72]
MKVYYVANFYVPFEKAYGIQLAKMCEALIEAGADVVVVAPRRHGGAPLQTPREFYNLRVPLPVRYLPTLPLFNFGRIGFVIASAFFMIVYLKYLWWKRLMGEKFVIHAIDMDQFSFALVPLVGVAFIAELHDAKPRSLSFAFLLSRARHILVVNRLIKEALMKNFSLPSEKITVAPNGIDERMYEELPTKEAARDALGIPRGSKLALYVGRLYDWKGTEILAEAARLTPDVTIGFLGATEEEYEKVTGEHAPRNLRFFGSVSHGEVPKWLAAADLLLVLGTKQNEYSYRYTSPMKLFEYLPLGRPIVAARTPAIESVVSEKEVFFYEPDNVTDLSHVITKALEPHLGVGLPSGKIAEFSWKRRALLLLTSSLNSATIKNRYPTLSKGNL